MRLSWDEKQSGRAELASRAWHGRAQGEGDGDGAQAQQVQLPEAQGTGQPRACLHFLALNTNSHVEGVRRIHQPESRDIKSRTIIVIDLSCLLSF